MANTLKFGAGQWATKEGSTLAYNDENNNFKPLPITFTRASSGTVINKAGLIETVGNGIPRIDFLGNTQGALKLEPQRTNLITQSEAFGNPYWTKSGATIQGDPSTAGSELIVNGDFATDSDWTINGGNTEILNGKLNFDNAANYGTSILNSASVVSGKTYLVEFTISDYTSGSTQIRLGSQFGTSRNANGTYTEYIVANSTLIRLYPSSDNTTLSIDNVSVKEVQGFTSPDGTTNAYKLVEGTNDGAHAFYNSGFSSLNGQSYTFSMFVKYNGRQWFRLWGQYGNSNKSVYFDIQNGLVGTKDSGVTGNIEDYGNGWYRISATATTDGTSNRFRGYLAEADNDPFYQGNGTSGVYIAFAQVEEGSYATSYIPTQGSVVTRLRDECLKDDFSILTVGNSYTLFFDVDLNEKDDNKTFFNIENTSAATSFTVRSVLGGVIRVYNNLDSQYPTDNLASSTSKWVVRIDGTSFKIFGAEGSLSGTLTTARDMGEGIFGRYSQTKINDFKVYNTALSDSECEALTQV